MERSGNLIETATFRDKPFILLRKSRSPALCVDDSVRSMCPKMCNLSCENLFGGQTTATTAAPPTTAPVTTTTLKPCPQVLTCQNGGTFNQGTCTCDCYPSATGEFCETVICSSDPASCSSYTKDNCVVKTVEDYCPTLCGKWQFSVQLY